MSLNYAPRLARDRTGEPLQEYPAPKLALAQYTNENASASSVIALNANTASLEVAAVGAAAVVKWIAKANTDPSVISAAGTANFDHVVPVGTYRRFVVPMETGGVSSIAGIGVQNGLYQRVAVKSVGASSVLTSEY